MNSPYYPVRDYHGLIRIGLQAFGMDLFIGDQNLLGKGLGKKIIETFIKLHIKQFYRYCIVDPDINNLAGIRCYEKLGFKEHAIIVTEDALLKPVQLKLMILDCNNLKNREQQDAKS